MFGLLVLMSLGLAMWWFFTPSRRFLNGFATLVDNPRKRFGFAYPQFTATVSGRFKERDVQLTLLYPSEYRFGEIELAMATNARDGSQWKDSTLTPRNPDIDRTTFDLEGKYELNLTLREQRLTATAKPLGGFFPGAFDDARWRNTLTQMHVLVGWLERGSFLS